MISRMQRFSFIAQLHTSRLARAVVLVAGVSLAIRIILLLYLLWYGGEAALFAGDSLHYLALADSTLNGAGYRYEGLAESFRAPGYPAYLGLFRLLNAPFWIASLIQITFSAVIAGWVTWFVAKKLSMTVRVAMIAGLVVAIEPVQVYYSVLLLPDVFFTLGALFVFSLVLMSIERNTLRYAVYAGIVIGLVNYIRPALLYLPFFLAALYLARAWWNAAEVRRAAIFSVVIVCSAFVVMSPWYLRNYIALGQLKFVSAKDYTMYAYVAASTKAAAEGRTYESVKQELLAQARIEAPSEHKESFENATYYSERTNEIIRAHPVAFIQVYSLGLFAFWTSGNYQYLLKSMGLLNSPSESISYSMLLATEGVMAAGREFFSRIDEPFILVALFDRTLWLCVFLLSLTGLMLSRFNAATWLTVIYFAYFSATILSTAIGVEARHRYALIPLMVAFATVAIVALYSFVRFR